MCIYQSFFIHPFILGYLNSFHFLSWEGLGKDDQFRNGNVAGWWWRTPLMPALGRQRQADFWAWGQPGLQSEFQVSQGYTEKPCLKKPNKQTKTKQKQQQQKIKIKLSTKEAEAAAAGYLWIQGQPGLHNDLHSYIGRWWGAPLIPSTPEAEAGESPSSRPA